MILASILLPGRTPYLLALAAVTSSTAARFILQTSGSVAIQSPGAAGGGSPARQSIDTPTGPLVLAAWWIAFTTTLVITVLPDHVGSRDMFERVHGRMRNST